jgi:hypothetical protein
MRAIRDPGDLNMAKLIGHRAEVKAIDKIRDSASSATALRQELHQSLQDIPSKLAPDASDRFADDCGGRDPSHEFPQVVIMDPLARLRRLNQAFAEQVITQADYDAKKEELMAMM